MEDKKKKKNKWKPQEKSETPTYVYETRESLYDYAVKAMNDDRLIVQHAYKIKNYLEAARMFDEVGDYRDAKELAARCRAQAEQTKKDEVEYRYQLASEQMKLAHSLKGYEKAEKMLAQVSDYKDVHQLIEECHKQKKTFRMKARIKSLVKLGIVLICTAALLWFLNSPAWDDLQEKMIQMNQTMVEFVNE